MTETFTQNDLISFFYNETPTSKSAAIEAALLIDNRLMDSYYELLSIKDCIEEFEIVPSQQAINKILNYSKSVNLCSLKE